MIITEWINNKPMYLAGFSGYLDAKAVNGGGSAYTADICNCYGECEYKELAFVNSNSVNWWQNDLTSLIAGRIFSTDTITFSILKNGVQIAVLNDNTYGTLYDYGSLYNPLDKDYLTSQAYLNYKGFIVDWKKVKIGFGYGEFQLKTTIVSLGTNYDKISHIYNVVEYNAERADNTVRIETYQKGAILNGFDYTGINWYQSIRIKGKFGNKKPTITDNNYQNTNREITQIQTKISNTFELETQLLPSNIYNPINYDSLLANDIFITDYNIKNQQLYRREPVYFENFAEVTNHELSIKSNFVYTFKAKFDNIVKRNIDGYNDLLPYQPNAVSYTCPSATILINSTSFDSVISGGTLNIPVKNTLGVAVGSKIGSEWIVPKNDKIIKGLFEQYLGTLSAVIIDTDSAGTYLTTTNDGSSGSITFSKNGGAFATFSSPLVLNIGDTLSIKRTIIGTAGWVKLID
jgi:hypothetical protein